MLEYLIEERLDEKKRRDKKCLKSLKCIKYLDVRTLFEMIFKLIKVVYSIL